MRHAPCLGLFLRTIDGALLFSHESRGLFSRLFGRHGPYLQSFWTVSDPKRNMWNG